MSKARIEWQHLEELGVDLHCHSNVSDGVLAPADVVSRAAARGVHTLALTDHDELAGLAAAQSQAESLGLNFIAGVEISVTWAHETIHIVGLQVDPDSPELQAGLAHTRGGRQRRAEEMALDLARVGIDDAYAGALKYVGNPDLISRAHFGRYLVEIGIAESTQAVFERYLTPGKPGYIPHTWASLRDAVQWIQAAGGLAVIAHPARYRLSPTLRWALYEEFKALGGVGLEVVTGSHHPGEYPIYAQHARDFGFFASRGSDFHGPTEGCAEFGSLAAGPAGLTPIWHAFH
ncbi:3',5'-nucleoside bisphosphate phosphatase [Parvibium lacunae]|uniref:3',5'-nucleoside bisphosphate phosphatase n=1 Tax=Parvibium lacunae TaxID=1888893 RepID=UPI001EFE2400|nr:3',5'-nucleoside bisphosphate phosphatase [Parvibium lacunae]